MSDFEWCTDCKEYDHEKHCCPRFNKVIRHTLNECINEVLDKIRAEIEQDLSYKPMEMWDFRLGMTRALNFIDKYRTDSEA